MSKLYYYADKNNQPAGPAALQELIELRSRGVISNTTYVVEIGDQNWKPFSSFVPPPQSPPLPPQSIRATPQPQHKRVGGWLLLFCLGLTVFGPLITLSSLVASFTEAAKYFDRFPGLLVITIIDSLLSLGLMTFGIFTGVVLWRVRPGALGIAKGYLLCFFIYIVIAAVLPFLSGLPSQANAAMISTGVGNLGRGVICFTIWYWYLEKSKRVKATYQAKT
ncbi:MAG: DUF2569 family protein [Verrucomicrobiia bacterium]